MQPPGRLRSLVVELEDGRAWGAYGSGELLHGCVRLELRGTLRLRALEVCARWRAVVHWLESRSVGLNIVYYDYTAFQTFLNRRHQLIPGKAGAGEQPCAAGWWVGTPRAAGLTPGRSLPSSRRCHLQAVFCLLTSAEGFCEAACRLEAGEHEGLVAFVLFVQGSANTGSDRKCGKST